MRCHREGNRQHDVTSTYAIGASRIKLLDTLLILVAIGGISVPIGHMSLKLLFRKYRQRLQEQAGAEDTASSHSDRSTTSE